MAKYIGTKEAARLLGKSPRQVQRMCRKGKLPGAIRENGRWKIPRDIIIKELRSLVNSQELSGLPADKRNTALQKLGLIQDFERFCAKIVRGGGTRLEAYGMYASGSSVTVRSLRRWIMRFHDQGLIGLVDTRGGGKFVSQMISGEAFEMFKAMYLTQQRLSVKICWQNLNYINENENKGWKLPALPSIYKYVKDSIPLGVQILHREGLAAYQARCAPYIQTDPDSVGPGDVYVGDHHQFNCWIRHRGRWVRPWITAWEDMRSREIVGREISIAPNQTTILLAMKRALEKYGPPDSVKIDNGRDYDSEMWTGTTKARRRALNAGYIDEQMLTGIYAMMDIGVSFSIKYHPQSKPLERWFDTLDCQFTKTIPTYCGKDAERKPDYLPDMLKSEKAISEAYSLIGFIRMVDQYIGVYNNTAHTGVGMDGRSPAQVMATRSSRRVLAEGVLDLLMRVWSGELKVGKNGVNFKGMWYGQYNPELMIRQGKKVRVAYDPDDLRHLDVYDSATLRLITVADQNQLIGYGSAVSEDSLRTAMAQKGRALKITKEFRNSRLTANMDLTSLTIKAMAAGQEEPPQQEQQETLRPVPTPMDGQVREHARRKTVKAVKKAVGAEGIETVLDIDFSRLKPKNKYEDVDLWND